MDFRHIGFIDILPTHKLEYINQQYAGGWVSYSPLEILFWFTVEVLLKGAFSIFLLLVVRWGIKVIPFIVCSTHTTTYVFLAAFKNISQALHYWCSKCRWCIVVMPYSNMVIWWCSWMNPPINGKTYVWLNIDISIPLLLDSTWKSKFYVGDITD